MVPCPICGRPAAPRLENKAAPFCTARCKQIDLGKWLSEEYRVPVEDAPGSPDDTAGPASHPSQEPA